MIMPSTLNVLIIGFSVIIFSFLWKMAAVKLADTSIGQAMAVVMD